MARDWGHREVVAYLKSLRPPANCGIGVELEYRAQGEKRNAGVFITKIKPGSGAEAAKLPVMSRLHEVSGGLIDNLDRARELLVGPAGSSVDVVVEIWKHRSLQKKRIQITRKVQP
jgi:S1-C subfamily serine protease